MNCIGNAIEGVLVQTNSTSNAIEGVSVKTNKTKTIQVTWTRLLYYVRVTICNLNLFLSVIWSDQNKIWNEIWNLREHSGVFWVFFVVFCGFGYFFIIRREDIDPYGVLHLSMWTIGTIQFKSCWVASPIKKKVAFQIEYITRGVARECILTRNIFHPKMRGFALLRLHINIFLIYLALMLNVF
jgi:hypothetical protein